MPYSMSTCLNIGHTHHVRQSVPYHLMKFERFFFRIRYAPTFPPARAVLGRNVLEV